jgi:type IV secretion system protein VirB3
VNDDTLKALRDPIFKGCTRPAMKFGVPLGPLIATFIVCFLSGMWIAALTSSVIPAVLGAALFVALLVTMRNIAKRDDQRFRQIGLALRLHLGNSLKPVFGAYTYTPYRYKRRRR